MRPTAVEHDADEQAPARGGETQRLDGAPVAERDGSPPVGALASAPSGLLHARLLLGLQAMAGNAAVANLIETRKPEPHRTVDTSISPRSLAPEVNVGADEGSAPVTTGAPAAEETADASPHAGESDDELAALDAAADAPPAAGLAAAEGERDLVAQEATAELTDEGASLSTPAQDEGKVGGAEPGAPIAERPVPVIPDVSTAEPATGLARVGGLPPAQLLSSLGVVSSAVDHRATGEHERLAATPPNRQRHPGAPATVESPASTRVAPTDGPPPSFPAMPEGRDVEVRRPPAPPVAPELPIANGQWPTRDPGLELRPGPLPHLPVEGNADPRLIQHQRSQMLGGIEREKATALREASRPLGEDEIFPTAPAETLHASIGEKPGGGSQATEEPKADEDDEAASIVAQQEKGAEIQSAVSTGLASLAGQHEEYAQRTAGERARADAEMSRLEQANSQEQAAERAAAKHEVVGLRTQWTTEQHELVAGAQREADAKTGEAMQTVAQERGAAEEQAAAHYEEGQQEAQKARRDAEQHAASERQKAQGQSQGGLLGAIGSVAQSLFDKARQAVHSVFDRARQLVRGAIERAQQLATAVMERAHQAIVGAIRLAGTVLTAIGDRVLVAFPLLRDRFRKAIQERIAAAETAVNKVANVLKHAVQGALNLLATALSAAVGFLHEGMQTAIDGVRSVVRGALDFARGALAAFGNFAVLVKDIAANPGRWIANLAAAVKDGIQNYLWVEIKTAVHGWFHDKVQEVVGVGQAIWHLLQRGGIAIAEVARMAWEGLKAAIPGILIALLIEKLMSLIVPAVGAILTIVQAIQAGWASLGRILQAFEAFFAFLRHVKLGTAGPLFAKAVAAGAIAAVEFVSSFLLTRLKGAASSVSKRLRVLARRIGERLAAIGGRIVRGVKAVGSGLRHAGQKVRAGFDRLRGQRPKSHADQERGKHEREQAAFSATKTKLDRLLAAGVSRAKLSTEAAALRLRYRWSSLRVQGGPASNHVAIVGGFSPVKVVTEGQVINEAETLEQLVSRYPKAKRKLQEVRDDPFISGQLKLAWMRDVETVLTRAQKTGDHPNPYEIMVRIAKKNPDNFGLGREIPIDEIVAADGLVKYVDPRKVFRQLKPEVIARHQGYSIRWVRKIAADPTALKSEDFQTGATVPGRFWSARRDAEGVGEFKIEHLRLEPKDYPVGAIRFMLPKEAAALPDLRRPTAFDGMLFPKWSPAASPLLTWGVVPPLEASKSGIKEGVAKRMVQIKHTIAPMFVPAGGYRSC